MDASLKAACLLVLLLCAGPLLTACSVGIDPTAVLADSATSGTPLTATLTASPSPTLTSTPTYTPSPSATLTPTFTPTVTRTPEPMPVFTTKALRPGVLPMPYLADVCAYLGRRWAVGASPPGAVVVPVMFHSIVQSGRVVADPKDISVEQFQAFVQYARYLGFETITTAQFLDFLQNNALIPVRSMILILDDRRPGVVREHFLPVLQAEDWTLTLAYIADPNSMGWAMDEVQRLAAESGRLDVQSHGYSGQLYITDATSTDEVQAEIWDSTPVLEARFGLRPLAFIWPGGNFNALAVQIARQGGYQLGFTAYSRGPVLFNWVPQGQPEQAVADPLMLLPRAWSNSVNVNLAEAVAISQQAVDFARQAYPQEAAYYRTYCGGQLPPLADILGE